jgi:hypothetical protein
MNFGELSRKFIGCHDPVQCKNHQHHVHDVTGMGHLPIPSNALSGAKLELTRRGRRATKPAAIVLGSRCTDDSFGSKAINEANLAVAVAPGSPANLAASCQGSTSSPASAERTLGRIPFISPPSGANRKSSNSGPSKGAQTERDISTTNLDRVCGTRHLTCADKACRVRFGFYSVPTINEARGAVTPASCLSARPDAEIYPVSRFDDSGS